MKNWILILFLTLCTWGTAAATDTDSDTEDRHLELQELVVRPKKEKYSKKNNPAVEFVRKVMERRNLTDPRLNNDYYNHGLYERINVGVINFPIDSGGALGFLTEYVDTTELTGRPVLNLSVKEKISDIHYRRDPQTRREVVRLRNRHGLDDLLGDAASVQTIFEEVMQPVDLYDANDIYLLRQKFVSPLGRLATDFYKFYLSDTIADSERGDSLIVLSFVPHNPTTPGFNGRLYVVKGDSTMFIRRAEMRLPKDANVNFISDMLLLQDYDRGPDGSRLKMRDEVLIEASYMGIDAYATRLSVYNSHNYAQPADTTVFDSKLAVIERNDLNESIVSYRPLETPKGAGRMQQMMARLRGNKVYYWGERILGTLTSDWIRPGGAKAPVAIGPIFSTISHNDLEGWRLRLGAMTTANLSRRFFTSAYGAYGFADRRAKYGASLEYSFVDKKFHPGEFPIRSIKVSHSYDTDRLGQAYAQTGTLFNSITRGRNDLMTYRRLTSLAFNYETDRNLNFSLGLTHTRQEATPFVQFIDGNGRSFGHFQQTAAVFEFRWAPGEKYYQSINGRKRIVTTSPVLQLTHTWAPGGVFGTRWGVNKTEMMIDKRWFFSSWGHLDSRLGAGHVWEQTVFPSLLVPNVDLSYIYKRNSFSLMNAMEFVNDTYVELHLNYDANGALLNYIPLIRKLKLRELVGFHAVWGTLSKRNNPAYNPELLQFPEQAGTKPMGSMPYMELNVGLGNILR
ncbi:MAG: carboxypeptidase-like regulatory domain-containing protein, partial [Muribaculaceae bacterium]|nr:carboxypeptidase-like regulatory domain-containing protein [Muribaculaceae bacterium]